MLVSERFEGSRTPFEGDRSIILRSLPEGAQVTKATVSLTPVPPPGGKLFEEKITFNGDQGTWGARKRETASFAEVDFHARRTLLQVTGARLNAGTHGASLQIDIGGIYVSINSIGTMVIPDDPNPPFEVSASSGGLLPSLATQKVKFELASQNPHIDSVDVRTAPANLSLRLGSEPPFWAKPGELAEAEDVPNYSAILNTFLAEAQAIDGYYEILMTLHSDTLCRLDVVVEVEFTQKQSALPGGVAEAAMVFDHSTLPQGEAGIISVLLPPGARVIPGETTARLRGSFGSSRVVYGPTGKVEPAGVVKVNPERAQAAPLIFTENLALSEVDLLLTSISRTAELSIDLVEDLDGKPGSQSALSKQVEIGIDSQIAGKPTWIHAALPVEVQVTASTRLWLVLQCLSGEVEWSVLSQTQVAAASADGSWTAGKGVSTDQANGAPVGIYFTDTGGLAWRLESAQGVTNPLAGMLHLRQPTEAYKVPIALQVGDGSNAVRVDLSRFEPLGRVDFNLDFAEFADAINTAASASAAAAVPKGEHLLNNLFETWRRTGDTPRPRTIPVPSGSGLARALATSPSGDRLYIVNNSGSELSGFNLAVLDTACRQLAGELDLGSEDFFGFAVSPDGSRACVLQDDKLTWVDLQSLTPVGGSGVLSGVFGRPFFSPGGDRLYLLTRSRVLVLSVGNLESEFASAGPGGAAGSGPQPERALVDTLELGNDIQAVQQVLSRDGRRLCLVVTDEEINTDGELRVYDVNSGDLSISVSLDLPENRGYGIALNPAGTRVVFWDSINSLISVYETRNGQFLGTIPITGAHPLAAVVDPDGQQVFVALERNTAPGSSIITHFNLSRLTTGLVVPGVAAGGSPADLLVTPGGETLYVADERTSDDRSALSSLPLGALTPQEWSLTAGQVQPVCVAPPFNRAALLGDFSCSVGFTSKRAVTHTTSALSQVVPVVEKMRYELAFWGLATSADVVAEIIWHGSGCGVQRKDRLPFQPFSSNPDLLKCAFERLVDSNEVIDIGNFILLHRLAAESPEGAELAEVRFTAPPNEAAFLDRVSLQASANALGNSDFQQLEDGKLVGWALVPQAAAGVTLVQEPGGLRFRNNGSRPASLEQAAPVAEKTPFVLTFTGQGESAASGAAPSITVDWLDAGGSAVGSPLTVGIGTQGSNQVARRGDTPAGAAAARLSLVVPPGSSLLVQQVSVAEVSLNRVPVYVIAQDEGELNVSNLQVVYDVALPAPPQALPPGGLCPPTPPSAEPGGGMKGCCYCPCCGEDDDLCDAHESETPAGRPALEGECCHCGARVQQIGGTTDSGRRTRADLPLGTRTPGVGVTAAPVAGVRAQVVLAQAPTVVRASLRSFTAVRTLALLRPSQAASGLEIGPAEPATPVIRVPGADVAITNVAGVSVELAGHLRQAELGNLAALSKATPSEIAAALPVADRKEARLISRRISRNARRLLKNIKPSG